jgi:hypothetical protein
MKQLANLPRRARWAVPAGAVVVVAGIDDLRGPGGAGEQTRAATVDDLVL